MASVYIALVELTDVLDLNLRHMHHFEQDEPRAITHIELALNNWIDSLDDTMRRIIIRGTNLDIPGAPNLRLAYLTIRLLLERISLEADKQTLDPQHTQLLNRHLQARRTAEEMLLFTQELQPCHLADFWLPSSAFSFPATVSFLLRCALETEKGPSGAGAVGLARGSSSSSGSGSSVRLASRLMAALRAHRDEHGWDIGEVCLTQHGETVERLANLGPAEDVGLRDIGNEQDLILPDVSVIDQFFPNLWDSWQGAW